MKHKFLFFNHESILLKRLKGIILTLLLSCTTFVSAANEITIKGATGITDGTQYNSLKLAFDAINANTSGLASDDIKLEVSASPTTEPVASTYSAILYAPLGISSLGNTLTAGTTTYKFPQITLTGGTNTATGTFIVTIYNGKVISIANASSTSGSNVAGVWSVAPTSVTIEGAGGPSGLNITTQATAFCTTSGGNLSFTITNGGAGYGPITSVTPASGGSGSGAAVGLALVSGATTPASGVISPVASVVSTNVYLDNAGTGYNLGAISTIPTDGTVAASGTTASYTITTTKANYASVKIYPTASGVTLSATSTANYPYIVLNGTSNVTIDGRVHTAGVPSGTANLIIQHNITGTGSTNNASTIYLNAGAHHNTISYCKLKSVTQNGNTRGTLAIGTSSISSKSTETAVGGSYNTISYNEFSALNPNVVSGTYSGNGGMLTSACFNDDFPNTSNVFDNNTFDNYFINGPIANISAAIYLMGNPNPNKPNHVDCSITNNSFFHSTVGATTASAGRVFIKLGNSTNYAGRGHTITGNYMGGKAAGCTGGVLTKTGAFQDNMTGIYLSASYGAATTIQNNVMKNISATNGGGAVSNTTRFIEVTGYGPVTVTNNTLGDNATGSLLINNSAITGSSTLQAIYLNTIGEVTCTNNTIGSITITSDNATTNFAGIVKSATAGNCTISNNIIGNASIANSIANNSGLAQYIYSIYSAGTGNINVTGNTIANITNKTTTGNMYGIYHDLGANAFNANANLIHSLNVTSTSTAAKVVGIYCASGTNSITNNIVKLNGDNASTIYGLDEEETATASIFAHNTVYISGAPTTGTAINSACIASNGATNTRSIQNNIFVNARTNNGATGTHYALYMPNATGTIAVNANDYQATGASGAMLGNYGGADVSTGSVIVTSQDANSQNVDPMFANTAGTTADSYIPYSSSITGVDLLSTVPTDYNALSRTTTPAMGALDFAIWNGSAWNVAPTTNYNARIDGTFSGAGFACRNLVLNAGKQLSISSGTLAVANNFTILSDAANGTGTLTNSGTLTVGGTTTVQQFISSSSVSALTRRNWYISSPLSAALSSTITTATGNGLVYYDGTTNWPAAGTTMEVMKGYIAKSPAQNTTINFTGGTLNTGNKSAIDLPLGFNLVGNPYPSYVDFAQATKTNVTNSIWYRSKKTGSYNFHTYNVTGGISINDGTAIIAPMQSFWIKTTNATNAFGFTDNMRSHQDQTVAANRLKAPKVSTNQLVRLQISNAANHDETVIYLNPNAQNAIDDYDTQKMFNSIAEVPEIYSQNGTTNLVINGMNTIPMNTEIRLGIVCGQTDTYSIKASELINLEAGTRVILRDKVDVVDYELTAENAYTFTSNAVNTTDRFSLIFRAQGAATGLNLTENLNAQIFVNAANLITIIAPENSNYAIYNAVGILLEKGIANNKLNTINCKLNTGVYFVSLSVNGQRNIQKVVIR